MQFFQYDCVLDVHKLHDHECKSTAKKNNGNNLFVFTARDTMSGNQQAIENGVDPLKKNC